MAVALVIWLVSTTFWPLALFGFIFGSAYGGWVAPFAAQRKTWMPAFAGMTGSFRLAAEPAGRAARLIWTRCGFRPIGSMRQTCETLNPVSG